MTAFFRLIVCFDEAVLAEGTPHCVPVAMHDVHSLAASLRGELLQCLQHPCRRKIQNRGDWFDVLWLPVGQTAGIGVWTRDGVMEAVTILASGLDAEEDAHAVVEARQLCGSHLWDDGYVDIAMALAR